MADPKDNQPPVSTGGLPILKGRKDSKDIYRALMLSRHNINAELPRDQTLVKCEYINLYRVDELNRAAQMPNLLFSRDRVQARINQLPKGETDKVKLFTTELGNFAAEITSEDSKRSAFFERANKLELELNQRLDFVLKKLEKTPNASGSEDILNTLLTQWSNLNQFRKDRIKLEKELHRIQQDLDKLETIVLGGRSTRGQQGPGMGGAPTPTR